MQVQVPFHGMGDSDLTICVKYTLIHCTTIVSESEGTGLKFALYLICSVSNGFSCDTKISHFLLREFQINLNKTA